MFIVLKLLLYFGPAIFAALSWKKFERTALVRESEVTPIHRSELLIGFLGANFSLFCASAALMSMSLMLFFDIARRYVCINTVPGILIISESHANLITLMPPIWTDWRPKAIVMHIAFFASYNIAVAFLVTYREATAGKTLIRYAALTFILDGAIYLYALAADAEGRLTLALPYSRPVFLFYCDALFGHAFRNWMPQWFVICKLSLLGMVMARSFFLFGRQK